jgi:hypothetical protein
LFSLASVGSFDETDRIKDDPAGKTGQGGNGSHTMNIFGTKIYFAAPIRGVNA